MTITKYKFLVVLVITAIATLSCNSLDIRVEDILVKPIKYKVANENKNKILEVQKIYDFESRTRKNTTRKQLNKLKHATEGNKSKSNLKLRIGYWNNKSSAGQKAVSLRDKLCMVLKENEIDILGVSESNIFSEDNKADTKIKGYETINDKLLSKYGRARSTTYIKSKLKYKVRSDLMDEEVPEVWIELEGLGREGKGLLVCQYYREHSEVRGNKANRGSETEKEQRLRLVKWSKKANQIIESEDKDTVLGGDMNANIQDDDIDTMGTILEQELIIGAGMDMVVKDITHQEIRQGRKCRGKTIDHIYTNVDSRIENVKAISEPGAHHKLIYADIRRKIKLKGPRQQRNRYRKNYSKKSLLEELDAMNWDDIEIQQSEKIEENHTEIMILENRVQRLTNNLNKALDKIAPMKTMNMRTTREPWINRDNLSKQKQKEKESWLQWKNSPSEERNKVVWEKEKKKTEIEIENSKSLYVKRKIDEYIGEDNGNLWSEVKKLMNWYGGGGPQELRGKDGQLTTKPKEMAKIMGDTFEKKVVTIAQELEKYEEDEVKEDEELRRLFEDKNRSQFKFNHVTKEYMEHIIKNLPKKVSTGEDNISYVDIRDGSYYVSGELQKITNEIISTQHWPSIWKNHLTKPLFKGGDDPWDPNGYRPISLTSVLSRTVERVITNQLMEYMVRNKLLADECHGFLGGRGTITGVLEIMEALSGKIDNNEVPALLGIDISGAFDCICRDKLIRQLKVMGLSEDSVALLDNYFKDRTYQIEIGTARSERRKSVRGVLQGSGLSPLLFLIYFLRGNRSINTCSSCKRRDISNEIKDDDTSTERENSQSNNMEETLDSSRNQNEGIGDNHSNDNRNLECSTIESQDRIQNNNDCQECGVSICYADDMNSISTTEGTDMKRTEQKIIIQCEKIESTLRKLQLSMNRAKTQFTICMNTQRRKSSRISTSAREERMQKINIELGGTKVTESDYVKTLGVKFESDLDFKQYWKDTMKPVTSKIFAIKQIGKYLSFKQRKLLGSSLAMSKVQYCLEATGCCSRITLSKIKKLVNRIVRSTVRDWRFEETSNCYRMLGWQKVEHMIIYKTIKLAKKMMRRGDPEKMINRFAEKNNGIYKVKENIEYRTEIGRRSFVARVIRAWSLLPEQHRQDNMTKGDEEKIKEIIKNIDTDWVLWGRSKRRRLEQEKVAEDNTEDGNNDENGEENRNYDIPNQPITEVGVTQTERRSDYVTITSREESLSNKESIKEQRIEIWNNEELKTLMLLRNIQDQIENEEEKLNSRIQLKSVEKKLSSKQMNKGENNNKVNMVSTIYNELESLRTVNNKIKTTTNNKTKSTVNNKIKTTVNNKTKTTTNNKIKTTVNDKVKTTVYNKIKTTINNKVKTMVNNKIKTTVNNKTKTKGLTNNKTKTCNLVTVEVGKSADQVMLGQSGGQDGSRGRAVQRVVVKEVDQLWTRARPGACDNGELGSGAIGGGANVGQIGRDQVADSRYVLLSLAGMAVEVARGVLCDGRIMTRSQTSLGIWSSVVMWDPGGAPATRHWTRQIMC